LAVLSTVQASFSNLLAHAVSSSNHGNGDKQRFGTKMVHAGT
jgi:hypothetical protein